MTSYGSSAMNLFVCEGWISTRSDVCMNRTADVVCVDSACREPVRETGPVVKIAGIYKEEIDVLLL